MNSLNSRLLLKLIIVSISLVGFSCNGNSRADTATDIKTEIKISEKTLIKMISFEAPDDNQKYASGDEIGLRISLLGELVPDSIRVYLGGSHIHTMLKQPFEYGINSASSRLGRIPVKVIAYSGDKRPHTLTRFILIFSDIVPEILSYTLVNKYPHDKGAYTQGLLVHNGLFYESTGKEGRSSIREVEIESGVVKREHKLESKFFGEGLVLVKDKLYQLTWEHKTGFIYDLKTFNMERTIHYDTQGWGLTINDDKIIMSDGTNKLYMLEPEYFTVISSIEVFDNKKAVYQLNELEYINGDLWANIYMTDLIAKIDPATGKVLAYLNLQNLLSETEKRKLDSEEVLNGIAWDSENKRMFVTGKDWPYMFEIRIR